MKLLQRRFPRWVKQSWYSRGTGRDFLETIFRPVAPLGLLTCFTFASLVKETTKPPVPILVPMSLFPCCEAGEELHTNPSVLLLITWLSGEVRNNFAVIF